jgi:hypothetical protein
MSDPLANPTLVLGLGRFGREVCALIVREAGEAAPPNLVVIRAGVGPDVSPESVQAIRWIPSIADAAAISGLLDNVCDAARGLLDLKLRVETTGAGDARPPRVDVFLLADLSEPAMAPLVPLLVERIGVRLRDTFRPIFGRHRRPPHRLPSPGDAAQREGPRGGARGHRPARRALRRG